MDENDDEVLVVLCYSDDDLDCHSLCELGSHIERAQRLFRPNQPSNLEYEIIRQKEINREMREAEESFLADFALYNTPAEGTA
jgi:hypothetical protein